MAKESLEELLEDALVPDEEWPYEVPDNWMFCRLGKVVNYQKGSKPKQLYAVFETGMIPYVNIDYFETRIPKQFTTKCDSSRYCTEKDILVVWDGARSGLVGTGVAGALGSTLCRINTDLNIYYKYLFYFLVSKYELINKNPRGTGLPHVDPDLFWNLQLPHPPLIEQQRIVDKIESLFSKLDQAKELIEEVREGFENRKAAILHKAFSGELTKKWREENDINFEKEWSEKILGNCGRWYGGGTPSKNQLGYWREGNIPWVTPKDMKSMYIRETEDKITENAIKESSAKLIKNEAILFVVRSGILRRILPIAMTINPVTINQDMKALVPSDLFSKYLYWYCVCNESDIRSKCAKSGTTVESINSELLYNYTVTVPPIEEQYEIVRILDLIFEKEQNAKELCALVENIDLMKESILARAFRGELGTNDPTEESALELLKQVLQQKTT